MKAKDKILCIDCASKAKKIMSQRKNIIYINQERTLEEGESIINLICRSCEKRILAKQKCFSLRVFRITSASNYTGFVRFAERVNGLNDLS